MKNIKDNRDEEEEMMGIPHIAGELNNDLYAIPVKRRTQKSPDEIEVASPDKERSDETDLPPGWEKHEGSAMQNVLLCLFVLFIEYFLLVNH